MGRYNHAIFVRLARQICWFVEKGACCFHLVHAVAASADSRARAQQHCAQQPSPEPPLIQLIMNISHEYSRNGSIDWSLDERTPSAQVLWIVVLTSERDPRPASTNHAERQQGMRAHAPRDLCRTPPNQPLKQTAPRGDLRRLLLARGGLLRAR